MTLFTPHGKPLKNPYTILGLDRSANDDEINKSFKKLMLKLHPDKQPSGQTEEEAAEIAEKFHNVMDAKSFLLDVEHLSAKRAYDSKLASLERAKHKFVIPNFSNVPTRRKKNKEGIRIVQMTDHRDISKKVRGGSVWMIVVLRVRAVVMMMMHQRTTLRGFHEKNANTRQRITRGVRVRQLIQSTNAMVVCPMPSKEGV